MLKDYLKNLSSEEREEMREKAKLSREVKKLAGQHLRQEYPDKLHHKQLASDSGLRLPFSHIPNTELKFLRRAMKSKGIDPKDYLEACGVGTLKKLAEMNPDMTAHEEVGLFLEWCGK